MAHEENRLHIGMIGTGRIARRFVREAAHVSEIGIVAVYNPHSGAAERFKEKCSDMPGVFRTEVYEAGSDGSIPEAFWEKTDAVYIASPHETHIPYIRQALERDKHVLCEKPMSLSGDDAEEVYSLAGSRGLVLLEAVKTAYSPGFDQLTRLIKAGTIGEISYLEAAFSKLEDPHSRELTDREYGGSFIELGSYVMLPGLRFLGINPDEIRFDSIFSGGGPDLFTCCSLRYGDKMATLCCGLGVKVEGRLMIGGSKGYILVSAPWWKTTEITIHREDPGDTESYKYDFEGDGLRYEIRRFADRIRRDPAHTGDGILHENESVGMADIMEAFLKYKRRNTGRQKT